MKPLWASWRCWAALAVLFTVCRGGAETVIVLAPDRPSLDCSVTFVNDQAREVTLGPFAFLQGQARIQSLPLSRTDRSCTVRVCDRRSGQVARATIDFGPDRVARYRFGAPDFFTPHTLRIALVTRADHAVAAVRVEVTDSANEVRQVVLGAVNRVEVVELHDLRSGPATVRVYAADLLERERSVRIDSAVPATYTPLLIGSGPAEAAPPEAEAGSAAEAEHQPLIDRLALVMFLLTLTAWGGAGAVLALTPAGWGVDRAARMRRAALFTVVVSGVILILNGLPLVVLGSISYLPVATCITAVQLMAASWLLLAIQARNRSGLSLATAVLIAAMAGSLLFVPALGVPDDSGGLVLRLSIAQVVLVLAAVAALVISRIRTSFADDARRTQRERQREAQKCRKCGEPLHPVTGTCRCDLVHTSGSRTRTVARLIVKSGKGAMRHYALGPSVTVGSGPDCDVCLSDDARVAKSHCMIFERGRDVCVRDNGQLDGTFVNGERVSERVLRDGDELRVGDSWLLFERV